MRRTVRTDLILTLGVAAVWTHQGLWCKVLRGRPEHEAIVADVPGIGTARARSVTAAIGLLESGLGLWVLTGRAPRSAATVQSALLAGMNGGGLLFATERIPDAGRMLTRNAGFLTAIWTVAALRGRRG